MSQSPTPWWQGAVIYQVYPRSFCDSSGDGVGDLAGLLDRLDHIASLGVDAVWVSPFFPSPMADFGYDICDYTGVDPIFGTLGDVDGLIRAAHQRGLKLIIDQVYSHSSDRHPWFQQSRLDRHNPKADWYIWADAKSDGTPPNNWQSVFGGPAWSWGTERRQYYLHNFLSQQPDLNLRHTEVQQALLDVAQFWLDRGVDGFRLDAANFFLCDRDLRDNPPGDAANPLRPYFFQKHLHDRSVPDTLAFLERFRAFLDTHPGAMAVAEIFDEDAIARTIEYTGGAKRLHTAYNFAYLNLTAPLSAAALRAPTEEWEAQAPDAWPSWAFSNHDVPRVVSRLGGAQASPAVAKLLMTVLMFLRGTIFVYQGEELGLPQAEIPYDRLQDPEALRNWPHTMGRDGGRTPMPWIADRPYAGFSVADPWLPVPDSHHALAVDRQEDQSDSMLHLTRQLIGLRRDHPALRSGTIAFADLPEPVLGVIRTAGDGTRAVALLNLGQAPCTVPADTIEGLRVVDLGLRGHVRPDGIDLPGFGGLIAVT